MTATEVTEAGDGPESQKPVSPEPMASLPSKPWWHRHLEPEDRRRIMDDLAIRRPEHWALRFTIMLTLSVIVAVMGLSLNSAAVVIGAMLLAPLMQPVLATGASLSMALFGKGAGQFLRVVAATTWCVAISFVLALIVSKLVPEQDLTSEVLSRTKPDIRDLIVAFAAGAAGAYATVREDASSSLPGVAVAVALVPPLGSVGITLEAGEFELALGALLLYATNLTAIIFVSVLVFVATGFVPPRRLATNMSRLALASVALAAVIMLVAYPLYRASVGAIEVADRKASITTTVNAWLDEGGADLRPNVQYIEHEDNDRNDEIVVDLRGFDAPPDEGLLKNELATKYPDAVVLVQWVRLEQATTTTTTPPDPETIQLGAVTGLVRDWLDQSDLDYQIDGVAIEDNVVRVDAAGTGDPPPLADLDAALREKYPSLSPRLNWVERETIRPGDQVVTPLELTTESLESAANSWAASRGLLIRSFDYDGDVIEVEISGASQPSTSDIVRLERDFDQLDDDHTLNLFFSQRIAVTTTLPEVIRTTTTTTTGG